MDYVGKSHIRVDAYGKVTGKAKYTADLCPKNALIAKVLHSTIANGEVVSVDIDEAKKVPGVVGIFTCFDVPDIEFPTAGHPYNLDPSHLDPADRKLLNKRVRLYGDDVAAVVAENEVAAVQALKKIKVTYNEFKPYVTARASMQDDAPILHPNISKTNCFSHISFKSSNDFNYDEAKKKAIEKYGEDNLVEVKANIKTPLISHCHIELPISYAYVDTNGKVTVVSSTQIPHICRRVVAHALGLPWGKVRVIKPYIGGGFGNKQDVLYEPLCAWLSTQVGGRPVFLEISREETIIGTRTRHPMDGDVRGLITKDGKYVARELVNYVQNGAYAGHGASITAKCTGIFKNIYKDELGVNSEAYTVYTNAPTSAAMRAYGVPQACSFSEFLTDDLCFKAGLDPVKFRLENCADENSITGDQKFYTYGLKKCIEEGAKHIKWDEKRKAYQNQTGNIRRGVGMGIFIYQTAVWPISEEISAIRMVLNQDGSIQVQSGATEIGQGADTIWTQMSAEATGISFDKIYVMSTQDTDITPFDFGAFGSRQSYVVGYAIKTCGELLKKKIIDRAVDLELTKGKKADELDIKNNNVVDKSGATVVSVGDVAMNSLYSQTKAEHIVAECTKQTLTNAFASGCTFVDIEVDMALGKIKINDIINVHDSGTVLNPALASAQVHGGMSMSLGFGLSEELLIDEKTGKPLNDNLLDYKIPTAMDSPDYNVAFIDMKDPTGGFGNKALGEPPAITASAAVRNAVLNATGVSFYQLPLTSQRLVAGFKEKGLID